MLNPAVMPGTSNSDNKTTMLSKQIKITFKSDFFSKLSVEIKAGNASHIRNEFGQVSVNPSMALNTEGKVKFVGANEDASDLVEDSDAYGCGLGFLKYRDV